MNMVPSPVTFFIGIIIGLLLVAIPMHFVDEMGMLFSEDRFVRVNANDQEIKEDLITDYGACLWAVACTDSPDVCSLEGITQKEINGLISYCLMQPNIDKYIQQGLMEDIE